MVNIDLRKGDKAERDILDININTWKNSMAGEYWNPHWPFTCNKIELGHK